jgi:hypothetical protein
MRKQSKVQLSDRVVILSELRVRDLKQIEQVFQKATSENRDFGVQDIVDFVPDLLASCSDLTMDGVYDLTFSDIEKLEIAFRELNVSFLRYSGEAVKLLKKYKVHVLLEKLVNKVILAVESNLNTDALVTPEA